MRKNGFDEKFHPKSGSTSAFMRKLF